jgi:hypothetical protein
VSETTAGDELRAEYQFDDTQAKPNRFAGTAKTRTASPGQSRPVQDKQGGRHDHR